MPQGGEGVDLGGSSGREPGGQEGDGGQEQGDRGEAHRVVGVDAEKQGCDEAGEG